jgi:hypothetical protein
MRARFSADPNLHRGASPLGLPDSLSRSLLRHARFRLRAKRYGETSPKPWRRRAGRETHSLRSFAPRLSAPGRVVR